MAYVATSNQNGDDQNQGKAPSGAPSLSGPIQIGPSAAPSSSPGYIPGSSSAPGVTSSNQGPTSSGSYNNIQNYINANAGNNFAGKIDNNLQSQANNISGGINDVSSTYNAGLQSKDINPTTADSYINNAVANPTQYSSNPSQFNNYLTASSSYTNPQSFDANQQLQSQVNHYGQLANLTQTDTGRQALLNQLYSTPYYSQGQQNLDNLILQGQTGQQDILNHALGYANTLNNTYGGAVNSANTLGQTVSGDLSKVQGDATTALTNAIGGFQGQADAAKQNTINGMNSGYQLANTALSNGQVTPAMLAAMGINPSMTVYKDPNQQSSLLNPMNYLQAGNTGNITDLNAITPEQQKTINALSALAGGHLTGAPSSTLSQFAGNTQAGSANITPYTFDKTRYMGAQAKASADLNDAIKSIYNNNSKIFSGNSVYGAPDFKGSSTSGSDMLNYLTSMENNPYENLGNSAKTALGQLQSVLSSYGLNPNTALGQTFGQEYTTVPDFSGAPSVNTGTPSQSFTNSINGGAPVRR